MTAEVSRATVQNWESGRSIPSKKMLSRLRRLRPVSDSVELPEELRGGQQLRSKRLDETRAVLHTALDLVMDNAPPEIRRKVAADLTRYAGQYGEAK